MTPCAHVFAQIKPSTRTRIDFGLALGPLVKAKEELPDRLIDTGGFEKKDGITHRIAIESEGDIDREVARWAKRAGCRAYAGGGGAAVRTSASSRRAYEGGTGIALSSTRS